MEANEALAKRLECAAAEDFEANETSKTFLASFKEIVKPKKQH
jgi:hypothetical protein